MDDFLTPNSRQNVITDIAQWKVELEVVGGGNEFTNAELESYIEGLRELDDTALRSFWDGTVAEWVASRADMPPGPDEEMSAEWLDEQYATLRAGGEAPWGYVSSIDPAELRAAE